MAHNVNPVHQQLQIVLLEDAVRIEQGFQAASANCPLFPGVSYLIGIERRWFVELA